MIHGGFRLPDILLLFILIDMKKKHFQIYFYAALLQILRDTLQVFDSPQEAFDLFPFLLGYNNALADALAELNVNKKEDTLEGIGVDQAILQWTERLQAWENNVAEKLPLRDLRRAVGLSHAELTFWLGIGLVEEDARFGALFEKLQGPGAQYPTVGLLTSGWGMPETDSGTDIIPHPRDTLNILQLNGLVRVVNPTSPRLEQAFCVPAEIWSALRGDIRLDMVGLQYRDPQTLPALENLVLPENVRQAAQQIGRLQPGAPDVWVVRGPENNGRRTLLGAVARSACCGILEVNLVQNPALKLDGLGVLATLLNAVPLFVYSLAPGEKARLPKLSGYRGPLGIVLGKEGGLELNDDQSLPFTLMLDLPSPVERRELWLINLPNCEPAEKALDNLTSQYRMSRGFIHRTARRAQAQAAMDGRTTVGLQDVRRAAQSLNYQALETLAQHIRTAESDSGLVNGWNDLAVSTETLSELASLESRCRLREKLSDAVHPDFGRRLTPGVRALLTGPSGSGKTLAATLLASILEKDLFRLDLSAVVNKYIGETEKNLNQLFTRAEELDVILLLDEGDSLLTQRTQVGTSNDRYANLETNYLLQRIEAYEGILLITTNAGERIDKAFQRRMDVVIEIRAPEPSERFMIWQLHLPPTHQVDAAFLQEAAARCSLNGGQIRNAVLHASLLALNNGGVILSDYLAAAIQREYRKTGEVCPLRLPGIRQKTAV